jgi:hypothetical protein
VIALLNHFLTFSAFYSTQKTFAMATNKSESLSLAFKAFITYAFLVAAGSSSMCIAHNRPDDGHFYKA